MMKRNEIIEMGKMLGIEGLNRKNEEILKDIDTKIHHLQGIEVLKRNMKVVEEGLSPYILKARKRLYSAQR